MGKKGKWAVARSLGFQRIDSVGDKTKASRGVEIDSFETIGFGTMPVGDETLSEHRRKKRKSAVASRVFPMARWEGVAECISAPQER